ncbi:hypothetical protein Tco_0932352 [Tanacetum coccineum]
MCPTPRQIKRGQDTKIPQSSGPPEKGSGPRCQDTILGGVDVQTRFETTSKQSNDPPLSKVNTFGSGEDSLKLMELMAYCTKLCEFVRKKNREKCIKTERENVRIYIGDGNVCWIKIGVNTAWHQLNTAIIKLVLLVKSEGSEGFNEIIDFLTSSHIYYALTECPTLYISLIEQFWQIVALSTTEDRVYAITVTIYGRDKIVTEASIRRHLKLQDSEGLSSLPNAEIFEHGVVTPLFDTMLVRPQGEAPSTYPSRITSSPSLSSHHTPTSTSNLPPSFQTIHEAEETATMPHDSPLPGGHTPEKITEQTKKTYSTALTKLVLKVKKLEKQVSSGKARRRARIVLSEDEDAAEEPSKQGRKIAQIDTDPTISLVQDEGTSCGEKGEKEISTADVPVSTAGAEVSTATHDVSTAAIVLVYIRRSASKAKDKGKAIMQEPEPPKKLKKRD